MTNNLVRRVAADLDRLPKAVERRIEAVHHRGLEVSAEVNAAAYVTQTGLTYVGLLTAEEERWTREVPLGADRYRAVVDHFTGVVCTHIAEMAL